jgi:pyruvate kinase
MRHTKIVATLGPSSDSEETIRRLLEAGVNVFRLNASHGTQAEHGERIRQVRRLAAEMDLVTGILLDLQGPKIRLGEFAGGGCELEEGSVFVLTTREVLGDRTQASVSYGKFAGDVKPGDRVLLADGSLELRVLSSDGVSVHCRVVTGGYVGSRKGVNLPGVAVSSPAMTRKDVSDLQFGLEAGIDMVALSFVRERDDIVRLRLYLEQLDASVPVVAKIEKPEAWDNIDQILDASDGVMVARGDLGVEVAVEKVPYIQKAIIQKARRRGKFAITATQMLESMVHVQTPTRAEVSDVANAIFDGTDAVMLSAETSAGRYPVEAARMMARVAAEADLAARASGCKPAERDSEPAPSDIVADAAHQAAEAARAVAIVALTSSGYTARLVARYRPPMPVYVFTPYEVVVRQLSVVYGLRPLRVERFGSYDEAMTALDGLLQTRCGLKLNDPVVIVAGLPLGKMGQTNVMKLHRVGEFR